MRHVTSSHSNEGTVPVGAIVLGTVLALAVGIAASAFIVANYIGEIRGLWEVAGWWGVLVVLAAPALVGLGVLLTRHSYIDERYREPL